MTTQLRKQNKHLNKLLLYFPTYFQKVDNTVFFQFSQQRGMVHLLSGAVKLYTIKFSIQLTNLDIIFHFISFA